MYGPRNWNKNKIGIYDVSLANVVRSNIFSNFREDLATLQVVKPPTITNQIPLSPQIYSGLGRSQVKAQEQEQKTLGAKVKEEFKEVLTTFKEFISSKKE